MRSVMQKDSNSMMMMWSIGIVRHAVRHANDYALAIRVLRMGCVFAARSLDLHVKRAQKEHPINIYSNRIHTFRAIFLADALDSEYICFRFTH